MKTNIIKLILLPFRACLSGRQGWRLVFCFLLAAFCGQAQNGNTGIGTTQPGSKLTINGSFAATYRNITAATYTLDATDYYLAWNGSASGTITLPASGTFLPPATSIGGRIYHIKNTGTALLTVTVTATATEQIDNQTGAGVSSFTLSPGYYAMIVSKGTTSGTTWEVAIVGNNGNKDYLIQQAPIAGQNITNSSTGTVVIFGGSVITLNSPTGNITAGATSITLQPGHTYLLKFGSGKFNVSSSATQNLVDFSWFDNTTGLPIGRKGIVQFPVGATFIGVENTEAIVSPTVATSYSVKITGIQLAGTAVLGSNNDQPQDPYAEVIMLQ